MQGGKQLMQKKNLISIFICMLLIVATFYSVSGNTNFYNKLDRQNVVDNGTPQILWWYDLDAPSLGSAAVDDIDGDGNLEIVFGTYFNDEHIYALNAESGTILWKYNTGGCNDASPAIADVDLDGDLEVIVPASSPYKVYCFNGANGQVEWSTSTGYPNCIDSPPAVADVDNDDKPEIILGTFYGYVFCLNGEDGSICWQTNLGTNSYIQSGPNILDLDGDGQLDIVIAQWSGDYRIYALKGDDASVLWYFDQPQDHMYHGGSFADIDEDGKPEIVIGCYDNHIYVVNGEDGSLEWDYSATYYIGAPTSIADLNNDGHLEIVFASNNKLGVLSHAGTLLWSHSTGGSIFRGASIADTDGDGVLDVVFGSSDGILRVLKGDNGQVIWTYNLEAHYGMSYDIDHAPVIADFNNDGELDVFVVGGYGTSSPPTNNHGRAYALAAGEGTGPGWPMFRHDLRHSACFGDNQPPNAPTITGPNEGVVGEEHGYTCASTDPEGDDIYYYIDWGDETNSGWLGPYDSGHNAIANNSWSTAGEYDITVKAKDTYDAESNWSDPLTITIIDNELPSIPIITGEKRGHFGESYDYTFISTDPEGQDVWYFIKWGDGAYSGWLGPYISGEEVIVNYTWDKIGAYKIKAKTKDIFDAESNWGYLEVIMPVSEHSYSFPFLQQLFDRFPNAFPILRYLLGL
jgi:outer membrane protein assembly factor BamB